MTPGNGHKFDLQKSGQDKEVENIADDCQQSIISTSNITDVGHCNLKESLRAVQSSGGDSS